MSRFYASIEGSAGEATRQGTANSGIRGHVRGWDSGVRVYGRTDAEGRDTFDVYATSGSNGHGSDRLLGTILGDGTWEPATP